MHSVRQSNKRGSMRRVVAAAVAAAVVGAVLTAAPVVSAVPSKTIAEVEAEIAGLENQAEIAAENLNGARVKLAAIQDKQAQTKSKIKSAKSALAGEAKNLGQMASQAYRSGAIDASVQLLMADNPADFLQQSAALEIVAKGRNTVLRRTTAARIQLDQANAALGQQEAEAAAVEQDIANQKAAIDSSLAEQQKVLSQLKEEERRRIEAERKAAAEAAARAAAAAQAAAQQFHGPVHLAVVLERRAEPQWRLAIR